MKVTDLFTPLYERELSMPQQVDQIELLKQQLDREGWIWVNRGSYSLVWRKGNDVIKVFRDNPEAPVSRCLIRFHRMAMKAGNPHFPKVHFVKTIKGSPDPRIMEPQTHKQHFVIGTERLFPMNESVVLKHIPKTYEGVLQAAMMSDAIGAVTPKTVITLANDIGIDTGFDLAVYHLDNPFEQRAKMVEMVQEWAEEYVALNPQDPLYQAYLMVEQMMEQDESCFLDAGGTNTMMRKDGTIVLSDPIADDIVGGY